jgi:PhnB protein
MSDRQQPPLPPVIPHLTVRGGDAALAFYAKAFGAETMIRMPTEDGKRLMHASMTLNGSVIMLVDDFSEVHEGADTREPLALGSTTVTVHLEVDDTDRWFQRAVDAGARVHMKPENMFWGARYARIIDPFGHAWSFGGPVT